MSAPANGNFTPTSGNNNSPAFLHRTHTSQDVLNEPDKLRRRESEQLSPPLNRRDSEPVIVLDNDDFPSRPNSRLSAKSRAKSPSLNSLKQGLKKANFIAQCLTKQNKPEQTELSVKVEDNEQAYKLATSDDNKSKKKEQVVSPKTRSSFLSFWQKPFRTQSTPSLAEPKPLSLKRPSESDLALDPVEEAIKSLENFGEFLFAHYLTDLCRISQAYMRFLTAAAETGADQGSARKSDYITRKKGGEEHALGMLNNWMHVLKPHIH